MNIQQWERATNKLVMQFIEKYYCDEKIPITDIDWFWVADEVGGVLFVNDNFYSLEDILDCARYNPTGEQLFEFCNQRLESYQSGQIMPNLKNWLSLNQEAKEEK